MKNAAVLLAVAASILITGCLQTDNFKQIATGTDDQNTLNKAINKITDNKTTIMIEPTVSVSPTADARVLINATPTPTLANFSEGQLSTTQSAPEMPYFPECITQENNFEFTGNCTSINATTTISTSDYCIALNDENELYGGRAFTNITTINGQVTIIFNWDEYLKDHTSQYLWPSLRIYTNRSSQFNLTNNCGLSLRKYNCTLNSTKHFTGFALQLQPPGESSNGICSVGITTNTSAIETKYYYTTYKTRPKPPSYDGTPESCEKMRAYGNYDYATNTPYACISILSAYSQSSNPSQFANISIENGSISWFGLSDSALEKMDDFPSPQYFHAIPNPTLNLTNIEATCTDSINHTRAYTTGIIGNETSFDGLLIPSGTYLSEATYNGTLNCQINIQTIPPTVISVRYVETDRVLP